MIITWLTGGLGNQMFQYAAGLALAERRRTVLKLDPSWFREYAEYESHNRYALSCLNITEQFATEEEVERVKGVELTRTERMSAGLARALRLYRYARRHERTGNCHFAEKFSFYPGFLEQPDNTYLHGMWQSERFFAPAADLLRLHFTFRYPPQPAVAAMARRIEADPCPAAMHFRRGDYVRNAGFSQNIGVLGLDYYRRAEELLRARHPEATLYIFSDDIDAIEREFRPAGPHLFVRATEHWHSYDKIRLMSLCHHAIISNSTFAWWGAWLGAPRPGRTVVAPDPWMTSSPEDHSEVVPASWTRLARQA